MNPKSPFFINKHADAFIASRFPDGDAPFHTMDMEEMNVLDAIASIHNDEVEAIVSEEHGGIIGYAMKGHAEEITTVLNMNYIRARSLD